MRIAVKVEGGGRASYPVLASYHPHESEQRRWHVLVMAAMTGDGWHETGPTLDAAMQNLADEIEAEPPPG